MKNTRKIDFSKLTKQTLEVLHTEKVNPDEINECSARDLKKDNHIRGEKRKALAHEIVAKGISGFRIENSSSGSEMIKYSKIRRISKTFKNGIKGFVQETSINPFKITLFSEIQIRMWDVIQQRYSVWHFDASVLFLNEINDQSKPFLFSIVCHDPISNSFIPLADFFTSANDSLNIQLNLIRIQQTFLKYKKSYSPSKKSKNLNNVINMNTLMKKSFSMQTYDDMKKSIQIKIRPTISENNLVLQKNYSSNFIGLFKNSINWLQVGNLRKEKNQIMFLKIQKNMESFCFNEEQLKYLRDFFEKNKIPNQDEIENINQYLGKEITKRNISIWFYNSRLSQNIKNHNFEEMDTNISDSDQSMNYESEIIKKSR
ncbi:unnamed protein product [Brachionus calyciflorus]|uniref:Homeobox domain-containing protein n=1 Tax=Brachionus calyciflorus TaxID=104777 RepID=A0A813ZG66_9BILA|nr:unnamed protein product [Brachionus calyciflorus]